jgi:hypothetical protein
MDTLTLTEALACAAVREHYPDLPSIGRLFTAAAQEYAWWQEARLHPSPGLDPAYIRERARTYWTLRGAALDICALQSDVDLHSAAQAAQAGNELRTLDGWCHVPIDQARQYVRAEYSVYRRGEVHPWNCPGRCYGTGTLVATLTWEESGYPAGSQGADCWIPVHQEPIDCHRGEEQHHGPDCACHGTGYTYSPGERDLCPSYRPAAPVGEPAQLTDAPWTSSAGGQPADPWAEPPF